MSIATEIQRLQQAKADIAEAIVAKGGEVSGTIDTYASAIAALPSGGGGVKIVEGDITLTSETYVVKISHNEGKIPFYATLQITDAPTPVANRVIGSMCCETYPNYGYGHAIYYNASLAEYQDSYRESAGQFHRYDNEVQFFSTASNKFFYATTYHYKFYFKA